MKSAIAAIVIANYALSAVAQPPNEDRRIVDLLQLAIEFPPDTSAERVTAARERFIRDTREIRSCKAGVALLNGYEGHAIFKGFTVRANFQSRVRMAVLPEIIRNMVLEKPVGQATSAYGDKGVVRVLIPCSEPTVPTSGGKKPIS